MARRACRSTIDQAESLRLRRLRAHLKRGKEHLDAFEYRLNALHADRTGAFRLVYLRTPLIPDEFRVVERHIARNEREAREGCPLCAAWLAETEEQRKKIDSLRMTPLPERDPTYAGWGYAPFALSAGKRRSRQKSIFYRTPEQRRASVAEYVERVMARKRRG
jgi:hypothetical protein